MQELDNKLRAYITVARLSNVLVTEGYSFDEDGLIRCIKQAFAGAGWVNDIARKHFNDVFIDAIKKEAGLMTGQEWYERFVKEVDHEHVSWPDNASNEYIAAQVGIVYTEAAKRAAGIEEQQ